VDQEDAIERALEPGEKIVWSDHPHGLLAALRRVLLRRGERYAATDRGRLVVASGRELRWTALPPVDLITTRARAQDEFGGIWFGSSQVAHDVSYPLIAIETLRRVAEGNRLC
jgi:hypothetical protein